MISWLEGNASKADDGRWASTLTLVRSTNLEQGETTIIANKMGL